MILNADSCLLSSSGIEELGPEVMPPGREASRGEGHAFEEAGLMKENETCA